MGPLVALELAARVQECAAARVAGAPRRAPRRSSPAGSAARRTAAASLVEAELTRLATKDAAGLKPTFARAAWSALAGGARAADGDNVAQRVGPVGGRGWSLRSPPATQAVPRARRRRVRSARTAVRRSSARCRRRVHVGTAQAEVKMCAFLLEKCLEDTTMGGRSTAPSGLWAQFLTAHASLAESYDLHVITPQWSRQAGVVARRERRRRRRAEERRGRRRRRRRRRLRPSRRVLAPCSSRRRFATPTWRCGGGRPRNGWARRRRRSARRTRRETPAARRFVLGDPLPSSCPRMTLRVPPTAPRTTIPWSRPSPSLSPHDAASLAAGAAAAGATAARGAHDRRRLLRRRRQGRRRHHRHPYADAAAEVASLVGQLTRTAPARFPRYTSPARSAPSAPPSRILRRSGASAPTADAAHCGRPEARIVAARGARLHAHWSIDAVSPNALLGLIALGAPRRSGSSAPPALAAGRAVAPAAAARRRPAARAVALAKKPLVAPQRQRLACGADGWLTSQLRAAAATYLNVRSRAGARGVSSTSTSAAARRRRRRGRRRWWRR